MIGRDGIQGIQRVVRGLKIVPGFKVIPGEDIFRKSYGEMMVGGGIFLGYAIFFETLDHRQKPPEGLAVHVEAQQHGAGVGAYIIRAVIHSHIKPFVELLQNIP